MGEFKNDFLARRSEQLAVEGRTNEAEQQEINRRVSELLAQEEEEGFSNFDPYERGRKMEIALKELRDETPIVGPADLTGKERLKAKLERGAIIYLENGTLAYFLYPERKDEPEV